jgi:thiol-disulfide isomerase/thioredoxin
MNIKNLLFFIILIITTFTACDNKETITENVLVPSKELKQELPTFNLTTTKGEMITIKVTKDGWIFENYKNKIVLLNFFATWCPPCKAEIPHLNNLIQKYKGDFVVLSVLLERDKPNDFVEKFIKKYDVKFPITNSEENFKLASAVGGVTSIPTMYLFNTKGLVYQNYLGAVKEEILDNDIKQAMEK